MTHRTGPTLEAMLCDRRFFALNSATPTQRAICRAADGRALGDLRCDPDVVNAFGGAGAISALPIGELPARVDVYSGIRTGKSLLAAAAAVCMSQRIDVSPLRAGEVPRIPIVSLDVDKARVVAEHILATVMNKPLLKALLVGEPTRESITLRHPSGVPVEVCPVAASRAGGAFTARWLGGAVIDELPRMLPASEGFAINVDDLLTAAQGRVLPSGQIWGIGSPWAPWGDAFDSVQNYWGRPSPDRVVIKTPGPTMNPAWWTPSRVEAMKKKDPRAYRADVLGEFVAGAAAALDPDQVLAAFEPPNRPIGRVGPGAVFIDAAGAAGGGGECVFAYGVGHWCWPHVDEREMYLWKEIVRPDNGRRQTVPVRDERGQLTFNPDYDARCAPVFRLAAVDGFDKHARAGITASEVVDHLVFDVCQRSGTNVIVGDQFNSFGLEALAMERGARFVGVPLNANNKKRAVAWIRNLLRERRAYFEAHAGLQRELLGLSEIATSSGGFTYSGKTTDYASLLVLAGAFDAALGAWAGSPTRAGGRRLPDKGAGDFLNAWVSTERER